MAQYQSLYRRFRPQKFSEVKGQEHVVTALRNAVRDEKVAHAYLFSGPRGTGKTSTARILAKALNCLNPVDGEPDDSCDSCVQITQGTSLDVHELDAASNNGVEAMRDLVSRTALGTPGRWKVYIVDEVHMLSTAASNALLKTLEEPPNHVVFVLATTDPQKVLPTIRSRTQHYEFRLLPADSLVDLLNDVSNEAHLDVTPEAIDFVVRRGSGSARDALSLLDQVAASGNHNDSKDVVEEIINGLVERDAGQMITAVAEGIHAGSDARRLATDTIEYLRNAFLSTVSKGLIPLPDEAVNQVTEQANRMGTALIVQTMESLGDALVEMRESIDPRLTLEVALIRAVSDGSNSSPETSTSQPAPVPRPRNDKMLEELTARVEKLEQTSTRSSGAPGAKQSLGGVMRSKSAAPDVPARTQPIEPAKQARSEKSKEEVPPFNRDELTKVWGDLVLDKLSQKARARFRVGRFIETTDNKAVCALPNKMHRDRCEDVRPEVEQALTNYFHKKISLELIVESIPTEEEVQPPSPVEEVVDLADTIPAETKGHSAEDRLKAMFPGAEEV